MLQPAYCLACDWQMKTRVFSAWRTPLYGAIAASSRLRRRHIMKLPTSSLTHWITVYTTRPPPRRPSEQCLILTVWTGAAHFRHQSAVACRRHSAAYVDIMHSEPVWSPLYRYNVQGRRSLWDRGRHVIVPPIFMKGDVHGNVPQYFRSDVV